MNKALISKGDALTAATQEPGRVVKDRNTASEVLQEQLEALARAGADEMLTKALNAELDAYLGRDRYERSGAYRGYRNGTTPRKLTLGTGKINLTVPYVLGFRKTRNRLNRRFFENINSAAIP